MHYVLVALVKNTSNAMARSPDIVIFGGGIAGLWSLARLRAAGYDVLLLERDSLGGIQSLGSQGIIHSGLKFAIAGKVSTLAQSISAMPLKWRDALAGRGPVDLSKVSALADSQLLLIPKGIIGGVTKIVTQKILGQGVHELAPKEWPEPLKLSGFNGTAIFMDELVLDMPKVIEALVEPHKDCIKKIPFEESADPLGFLKKHNIKPKRIIYTSATSNHDIAKANDHNTGLETQKRPLLMGMMRGAPYPLYAHCIGTGEKPVVTITTHTCTDGTLVWYLGGLVAERSKDADPKEVYKATCAAFSKYLPNVDLSNVQWSVFPVDRSEGKSKTDGWMPDTPTIHHTADSLYCWPTKMTFAPMLGDMIIKTLAQDGVLPSGKKCEWEFLEEAPYAISPWEAARWTDGH